MNVQELIDELEKIEDKTLPIALKNFVDGSIDLYVGIEVTKEMVQLW